VSERLDEHARGASDGPAVHPSAVVEARAIGAGCTIAEHASLAADVVLAEDVRVDPGARVLGAARLGARATIGANATVRSVVVGRGAVVEPASVVDDDVPPYAIVRGNPARIVGYVDALPGRTAPDLVVAGISRPTETGVTGVRLIPLRQARDLRGSLSALEFEELPFTPQRVFVVHGVPDQHVRGAHAHRRCAQVLVCVSGEVSCVADDGVNRQEFRLSSPSAGVLLPALVWGMQYRYSADAVLVVLAELPYDPADYVRDYDEFLGLVSRP
jgi:dTDP-4-dehydrorhamnose 3,5-epimerase-like enzyme